MTWQIEKWTLKMWRLLSSSLNQIPGRPRCLQMISHWTRLFRSPWSTSKFRRWCRSYSWQILQMTSSSALWKATWSSSWMTGKQLISSFQMSSKHSKRRAAIRKCNIWTISWSTTNGPHLFWNEASKSRTKNSMKMMLRQNTSTSFSRSTKLLSRKTKRWSGS